MPMTYSPMMKTDTLTLPNGLRVTLEHVPRLKRAAAAVRVAAGSHDAPSAWPGLAHFLEHLFFLGTATFPADQSLMPYVQQHGGQVNASTRDRTTDFFFELTPAAFEGGLARLCDMLAHPRLALDDQRREREVLHAEFIAWSREATTHRLAWLTAPLSRQHPATGFHAGNRYSLQVPNPAFQAALHTFHQRYYHGGQMTLALVGPQSLDELRELAERYGNDFSSGTHFLQALPPPLRSKTKITLPAFDPSRLNLTFALEGLPAGSEEALRFLFTWLTRRHAGGLLNVLTQRGWIDAVKPEVLYRFADQALVTIEFTLTEQGQSAQGCIAGAFFDWLRVLADQDDWGSLREEYALLKARERQTAPALLLARGHVESPQYNLELSAESVQALRALLNTLCPEQLLHPVEIAPEQSLPTWALPPANPFLRSPDSTAFPVPLPSALHVSQALSSQTGEGALYLRWRAESAVAPDTRRALLRTMTASLKGLTEEAGQAGVDMTLTALGPYWQLKLAGYSEPIPAVLAALTSHLTSPTTDAWASFTQPEPEAPAGMPIRALLNALPDSVANLATLSPASVSVQTETNGPALLADIWARSHWDGLVAGLPEVSLAPLGTSLVKLPGKPAPGRPQPGHISSGHYWQKISTSSVEHAIVLFCPAPPGDLAREAAWRLLAQLVQSRFYQRMRVELQLGYAVFSSFRHMEGQPGLLFGIQSPAIPTAVLLAHTRKFFEALTTHNAPSLAEWTAAQQALGDQFNEAVLEPRSTAEQLWQAYLGGHSASYFEALRRAIEHLTPADFKNACQDLTAATHGWLCLGNHPAPEPIWRTM
ncbi:coenzyme PQQ biosynthesis probable peptidase PqqF [Pseudomonas duriflava]|uniref:Coenzyme PQQ synthesis protein F n=1 Tax=Pseudomonas duriflava TaxID=459528 RepID=A0A562QG99_9PSED|nr:pyrroloquinoline quinone biosynthesis protein PqqF [Pseudomonas duriflava]TWI55066.1 coenzyme PQQ biosynthesis probable peptidase PqqF [Pseudomonas duriflava]